MRARDADFLVALGDMTYADDGREEIGFTARQIPGRTVDATVPRSGEHWRYNRADAASRASSSRPRCIRSGTITRSATTPAAQRYIKERSRGAPHGPGRVSFIDYQPLVATDKFYRSVKWGRNLEVFILDTRSYRDANLQSDTGKEAKTLLGDEQRRWFIDSVLRSDATWKLVVSSVPMSIPTGADGWAHGDTDRGFERELIGILKVFNQAGTRNLVWITTDVHFATGFRYQLDFFHGGPRTRLLELVCGPLNAGMFPKQDLDPTLQPERLFFYGGPTPQEMAPFSKARQFFNFGEIDIDAAGELTARIINSEGTVVWEGRFSPE
jgi:alkaline phosphatase D